MCKVSPKEAIDTSKMSKEEKSRSGREVDRRQTTDPPAPTLKPLKKKKKKGRYIHFRHRPKRAKN